MSLLALFLVGSVLFFATTWATVAFGVTRMQQLQHDDLEQSGQVVVDTESGLTELHVERAPSPTAATEPPQTSE